MQLLIFLMHKLIDKTSVWTGNRIWMFSVFVLICNNNDNNNLFIYFNVSCLPLHKKRWREETKKAKLGNTLKKDDEWRRLKNELSFPDKNTPYFILFSLTSTLQSPTTSHLGTNWLLRISSRKKKRKEKKARHLKSVEEIKDENKILSLHFDGN